MAAINAKFFFVPSVPGPGSSVGQTLDVTGETLTEVKQKVKDALAAKRLTATTQIAAIDAADMALDG